MTDPKRRSPAAFRARQRQRQAGGPHDEGRTRGEEERMAIAEQLDQAMERMRQGPQAASPSVVTPEERAAFVEAERDRLAAEIRRLRSLLAEPAAAHLDRLAAENAELRARLERVESAAESIRRLQATAEAEAKGGAPLAREWADALKEALRRVTAALDGGGEMGGGVPGTVSGTAKEGEKP